MLATLRQQLAARLLAQVLQHVQLLVESFGSATDAGFVDLAQPLVSMTGIVDVPAGTGDRPAAIDRFQPTHDSGQIFERWSGSSGLARAACARPSRHGRPS